MLHAENELGNVARSTIIMLYKNCRLHRQHQNVIRKQARMVRIVGPNCQRSDVNEGEDNAQFKAMLFTPWSCQNPMLCGCVTKFKHLLSNGNAAESATEGATTLDYTFKRGWILAELL